MTELVPRSAPRPLHYRRRSREEVVAAVLDDVLAARGPDGDRGLYTRATDDATVALVHAWATVAEIVGFYQDRIAAENYLSTAVEPESLLALAALTGYRPRPGAAASTWLAYDLVADPRDEAVVLPAGLLVQSVPRTGETPQTFETTGELTARPSWNRLPVRTTRPLRMLARPAARQVVAGVPELRVAGAGGRLVAGDVLLVHPTADRPPAWARVTEVATDPATGIAEVAVACGGGQEVGRPRPAGDVLRALEKLVPRLTPDDGARRRPEPEGSVPAPTPSGPAPSMHPYDGPPDEQEPHPDTRTPPVRRRPKGTDTETAARLLTALRPELAAGLYPALAATVVDRPRDGKWTAAASVSRMQVRATPVAPPGAAGTIGPTRTLTVRLHLVYDTGRDDTEQADTGRVEIGRGDTARGPAPSARLLQADLEDPQGTVLDRGPEGPPWTLTWTPAGEPPVQVVLALDGVLVTLSRDDARGPGAFDPRTAPTQTFALGPATATVTWAFAPGRGIAGTLTVSLVEPLPPADLRTMHLDTPAPGIVRGGWVVVDRTGHDATNAGEYPVVAQVRAVDTVPAAPAGRTLTRLQLDRPWLGADVRHATALQELAVHAVPEALEVLGPPDRTPVAGRRLELDGLVPGLAPGRRLIVAGVRDDLPGTATLPAAEVVTVARVTQGARRGGDTPHTTLVLAADLAHRYRRDSVVVHGNVVGAHHGETVTEPLTPAGGDPGHPTVALARTPVLADLTPDGPRSSLTLTVDGRTWTPVRRFDDPPPPQSYLTGTDARGHLTVTLSERLPRPTSTVVATYRSASPGDGNVGAGTLTQAMTRPMAVAGVTNPLPASGGAPADGADVVRTSAAVGLRALDRVVSAADAADIALSWGGVGKAVARLGSDGRRRTLEITVAGTTPAPLAESSALCTGIAQAVRARGDLSLPVVVHAAPVLLVVLYADVRRARDTAWEAVERDVRDELCRALAYTERDVGEDLYLSDVVAVAHRVEAVESFEVTTVRLLDAAARPSEMARLGEKVPDEQLRAGRIRVGRAQAGPGGRGTADRVAYVGPYDGTLNLRETS